MKATSLWKTLTKDVKDGALTLQAVKSGDIKRPRMRKEVPLVPQATKLICNKVHELSGVDRNRSLLHAQRIVEDTWYVCS